MKRHLDLFPIQVNPFNFTKGDVVKKFYTDSVQTPYVGVVRSISPSTNVVEVQWPYGVGLENPAELIKVNPILNPPVVNEDKGYSSYQNQLSKDYYEKIQAFNLLKRYLEEHLNPAITKAANYYNGGLDKKTTFFKLIEELKDEELAKKAIDKVYDNQVNISISKKIKIEGVSIDASLSLIGNDNEGFTVTYIINDKKEENKYSTFIKATNAFNQYKDVLEAYEQTMHVQSFLSELRKKTASLPKNLKQLKKLPLGTKFLQTHSSLGSVNKEKILKKVTPESLDFETPEGKKSVLQLPLEEKDFIPTSKGFKIMEGDSVAAEYEILQEK